MRFGLSLVSILVTSGVSGILERLGLRLNLENVLKIMLGLLSLIVIIVLSIL